MYTNDPSISLGHHLAAVEEIVLAGGTAGPAWAAIKANYDAWEASTGPSMLPLIEAITGEKSVDAKALAAHSVNAHLAAIVESDYAPKGRLQNAVDAETLVALRNAWAAVAQSNFDALAAQYDKAVAAFVSACSSAGDPNASAVDIVSRPKPEQNAWLELPSLAARIDGALAPLITAGRLAGLDITDTEGIMSLALDSGKASAYLIRPLWDTADPRLGRWLALLDKGVTLRAASLDKWTMTLDEQQSNSISVQEFSER